MYKHLRELGLSRSQIAGIRMRLINVFLDKNENYSVERMINDIEVIRDDIILIKSGYFNNEKTEVVSKILSWLITEESQFKKYFIENETLQDYHELNVSELMVIMNGSIENEVENQKIRCV